MSKIVILHLSCNRCDCLTLNCRLQLVLRVQNIAMINKVFLCECIVPFPSTGTHKFYNSCYKYTCAWAWKCALLDNCMSIFLPGLSGLVASKWRQLLFPWQGHLIRIRRLHAWLSEWDRGQTTPHTDHHGQDYTIYPLYHCLCLLDEFQLQWCWVGECNRHAMAGVERAVSRQLVVEITCPAGTWLLCRINAIISWDNLICYFKKTVCTSDVKCVQKRNDIETECSVFSLECLINSFLFISEFLDHHQCQD